MEHATSVHYLKKLKVLTRRNVAQIIVLKDKDSLKMENVMIVSLILEDKQMVDHVHLITVALMKNYK